MDDGQTQISSIAIFLVEFGTPMNILFIVNVKILNDVK